VPKFVHQQTESEFQSAILQLARLCGWWVYHPWYSNHSERGWPDLVIIGYGQIMYRELKSGKRKVTPSQAAVIELINANGGDAKVWRPEDWPEIEETLTRETAAVARKRVRDAERAATSRASA
jgi:hypothetical protein